MSEWLPIETAPIDGTWIDLWVIPLNGAPAGRMTNMYWMAGCFRHPPYGSIPGDYGQPLAADVTHWMPLSKPPGAVSESKFPPFQIAKGALDALNDDDRVELFRLYCVYCGSTDPGCQCWNDD